MIKVFLDASGQVKLDGLQEPVEVCTSDGRTLGLFSPIGSPTTPSPHSIEELEELRKVKTGRTLTEIRDDLNKRGIPL
jgi:hypothetical protein